MHREKIMNKLTVTQQQQTVSEEQRIAKAVAEQDARQAQQQQEQEEKKATMMKSITAHREAMVTQIQLLRLMSCKMQSYLNVSLVIDVGSSPAGSTNVNPAAANVCYTCNANCVSSETRKGAEGQNSTTERPRHTSSQERG